MDFYLTIEQVVAMLGMILGLILVMWMIKVIKKKKDQELDTKVIRKKWNEIIDLLDHRKEMNYKLAVIEADKLLDYVLKLKKLPGQTMAERLKAGSYQYPTLKQVWWAHKVRNKLVHDQSYHLRFTVAKKVLSEFKKALFTLKAI